MRKTKFYRFSGILLSALLLLGSVPVYAISDGVSATYDEAYYATTDYYGNLTEGGVVKSYATNGTSSLTDYGIYDEVINLTDSTKPTAKDGKISFDFSGKTVPERFYFEGKTAAPFRQLPWTISVHYMLNGVPAKAEDLAGKTGVVEINIDAIPNKNASEYARNNYIMMATAIINQDDILSLEAPGAQVQLVGNLRTVIFVGFPGEEEHFVIRVGSEDFSFGGLTFMMMPATLSQLDQIAELSERKDDLEKNYDLLSSSLDILLDSVSGISGSLYSTADGLDELNTARGIISNGKGNIYDKTDTALGDLKALNDSLSTLPGHLDTAAEAVDAVDNSLDDVSDALHDLQEQMEDAKDDLDTLQSALNRIGSSAKSSGNDLKTLGGYADTLSEDLEEILKTVAALEVKIAGSNLDDSIWIEGMPVGEIKSALQQAASLDHSYRTVGKGKPLDETQFLTALLMIQAAQAGGTLTDAEAKSKAEQMQGLIQQVESSAAARVEGEPDLNLETAIGAVLAEMAEQDPSLPEAYTQAKQLSGLYTLVSGGSSMNEQQFFTAILYTQSHDMSKAEALAEKLLKLYATEQNLISGAETLCALLGTENGLSGDLSSLLSNTGSAINKLDDLSGTADDLLDEIDNVLDALDDLGDTADKYIPDLKATLTEAKTTVTTLMTTVTDTHSLLTSLRDLLKVAGEPLDSGTKKTLEGLAASLRATARSLGTTSNVKSAKNNLSSIIEDTWNEYTGEKSNMLLMDSTAEAVSLTDSRNAAPQSIQVLIRTQEIKVADESAEDITSTETMQTTFWQRVGQMFKDFWAAITGIFR